MKWPFVRFFILGLTILACIATFNARTCINIAIVEMVQLQNTTQELNDTQVPSEGTTGDAGVKLGTFVEKSTSFFPWDQEPSRTLKSFSELSQRKYNWDQMETGLILQSFYWSYILFTLPAEPMIRCFGEKWVMAISVTGSAIVTILTPAFSDCLIVMILSRFILGITQAGFMPAAFALTNNWLPLQDRAIGFACLDAGAVTGAMVTFFASGFVVNSLGWPSLFIASGAVGLVVALVFAVNVTSRPDHHTWMGDVELHLIKSGGGCKGVKCDDYKPPLATPWMRMLMCPAVLATALFKFSISWTYMVFYTNMPAFLKQVVGVDITSNGIINAGTSIFNVLALIATGWISERMIQGKMQMKRTRVRKFFALFSGFASAAVVACIPLFVNSSISTLNIILFAGSFFNGFQGGSDLPLPSEMTANYPALMYSLMNVVSTSTGFIVPAFISAVLQSMLTNQMKAWNIVFYSSAALSAVSTVIFLVFASAERQSFDFAEDAEDPSSLPDAMAVNGIKKNEQARDLFPLSTILLGVASHHSEPDKLVTPL